MQGRGPGFRLLVLVASFASLAWSQNVITTVVGTNWIFRGDGGPAGSAPLGQVIGVAAGPGGTVYVADPENHIIGRIEAAGTFRVVAGNGIPGFSGDGGVATSASLASPSDMALDLAGNLFIADRGTSRIRKVTPDGVITTIAGTGTYGYSGDGGPATAATMRSPWGVAVDGSGNIYISDTGDHRIRKVTAAGIISTIAGNGTAGFSGDGGPATAASLNEPRGIAVDAAGNVFFADYRNDRVRKISAAGGITTVAGGGGAAPGSDNVPATSVDLSITYDVAVAGDGSLYIAESVGQRIRKVSPQGIITTVAGNGVRSFAGDGGPALSASFNQPEGVAIDAGGTIYIGDTYNNRVRKVAGGIVSTIAGNSQFKYFGDGAQATSAALNDARDVAVDATGNLYVADSFNRRIRKVALNGIITTFAGTGVPAFSGDGGLATNATMKDPVYGVAVDAGGNVYIADGGNHRIRKVTPNGVMSTFAGGGACCAPNDGGPATAAYLGFPVRLAVDAAGAVYIADGFEDRIRKVAPNGTITTVAGNGTMGFSGDGGPATSAQLNRPEGVAVDTAGNIYIADMDNHRVRKVSSSGIISTLAGTGTPGLSGDGGPATAARLSGPCDIAVDAAGNVYIADYGNHRIRQVSANGAITTVAGTSYGFSGDGGPATSAALAFPAGLTFDAAGSLLIAEASNDRVRKVLTSLPSFAVAPALLNFAAPAGTPNVAAQQVAITAAVTGIAWNAQASTLSGGNWLTTTPATGSAPGITTVSVNVANLSPGTYQGTIALTAPQATPPSRSVAVQLTVQAAEAARLGLEPASLSLEAASGGSLPGQPLRIRNDGGAILSWTARAQTASGGNWLSVSAASGTATAAVPSTVQVNVNAASLGPGTYSGTVVVDASGQSQTLPVTVIVSAPRQTILLSQTGLLFTGVEGGNIVPPQSFGVLNSTEGTMSWTAEASTLSGGNWLTTSPSNGSTSATSLSVPIVDVGVNVTNLKAGQYSGLVKVSSPTAVNSPQYVTVELNVLPAGSNPGVLVRPTGLIFATQAGTSSPGSQTIKLSTAKPGSAEARGGILTFDGKNWFAAVPPNSAFSPTQPATITIQPDLGTLARGIYQGAFTLLFSDQSPSQVVNVLFLVAGPTGASSDGPLPLGAAGGFDTAAVACSPQKLVTVFRTLGNNFAAPVGWPSQIEVQVTDDCGSAIANASVVASFSSGDPPLTLVSLRNGTYVGTWRPVRDAARITVTVRATLPPLQAAEVRTEGTASASTAPLLYTGGVVNGASFAKEKPLAPGAIVSVFGRNLALGLNYATTVPLETRLGGATLNVGGQDVPLFFSGEGQINAQLPFELKPNSRVQVVVKTARQAGGSETVTVPDTITLAATQPAIFTTNQQGTGQGAVLDVNYRLVDGSAPVAVGDYLQIYCTGLGATNPGVVSGQRAPASEPLARVTTPVQVLIDGIAATVHYAGLAPGYVGLYQINVQVPAGVKTGGAVPLVLVQDGVQSNTATIAVR